MLTRRLGHRLDTQVRSVTAWAVNVPLDRPHPTAGDASTSAPLVFVDLSLARFPGHFYSAGEEPVARYDGKATRSYSDEFKRDAVRRVGTEGRSLTQVARELDVHPNLLQSWQKKYRVRDQDGAGSKTAMSLEEENRRLRHENAGLREDREDRTG